MEDVNFRVPLLPETYLSFLGKETLDREEVPCPICRVRCYYLKFVASTNSGDRSGSRGHHDEVLKLVCFLRVGTTVTWEQQNTRMFQFAYVIFKVQRPS